MTLDELDAALKGRKVTLQVSYENGDASVLLTHLASRKLYAAWAHRLEDAVELAMLRFDNAWNR